MSFSVEDLQAQISQSGGLAQKHQFMVQLPQLAGYTADLVELSLFCTVASIPGRQIMSQDQLVIFFSYELKQFEKTESLSDKI